MPVQTRPRAVERAYHHGDLERALVDTAVRTIGDEGVSALTLRSVGARLGVSRTALYRHFDDKAALLARVAEEGFRRLHAALTGSLAEASATGADPLPAMSGVYVRFARANPSHYQTMFGGFLTDWSRYPDFVRHADAAFNVLVDSIREEQRHGRIAPADPVALAEMLVVEPRRRHARDGAASRTDADDRRGAGGAGAQYLQAGLRGRGRQAAASKRDRAPTKPRRQR